MNKDKKAFTDDAAEEFETSWTLENAMHVVRHPTVDARIWAEAVEWLLLYGPEEIQEILRSASLYAAGVHFPDLKPAGCTPAGDLCYSLAEIASALRIDSDQALLLLKEKEQSHGVRHGFDEDEVYKLQ